MGLPARRFGWLTLLVACLFVIRYLSNGFSFETDWEAKPVYTFVMLLVISGVAYLGYLFELQKSYNLLPFWLLVFLGFLLRIMWNGSEPILEDDSYRYFWDGALVVSGLNPYIVAPLEAFPNPFSNGGEVDPILQQIVASGSVERIAYPAISTIYPPITQIIFAAHSYIGGWDLDSWRLMLIGFDSATLLLLMRLLKALKKPTALALIYWLNPLVIVTVNNAGHMDALLLPFLVAAAIAMVRFRFQLAALSLACAVGIKIWPIVLAPIFAGYWFKHAGFLWRHIVGFGITLTLLSAVWLSPQVLSNLSSTAGLVAYSSGWQTNALLFRWIEDLWSIVAEFEAGQLARLTVGLVFLVALALTSLNAKSDPTKNLLWITAALFFLSPTGYPWYYAWLLPWLVMNPSPALLALTVTLPLYHLRFAPFFDLHPQWFDWVIVPLQFIPPLFLIAWQKLRLRPIPSVPAYA